MGREKKEPRAVHREKYCVSGIGTVYGKWNHGNFHE